ncbi:major facilitator superfamily domain-containing protein 10 isoform X4 [Lynx canadensis]|uniref:major facilitator superfamily domain-containing protein 10 isoform X4 n=1 Tax=Lynx canadensis TaxID=61383 RepID=UPI0011B05A81|nr:major facilitator superfamily domain-containing protein 10 isoform X4 [Lynx canadensis]
MGWGAGGSCTPRPPIRQQPLSEPRVITVVFLGLLLDLLAFTLLLPLLPGLLESHGRAHDPLYGSWQQGVDWFAAAIRMPAEKRYNSVLFGGLIGSVFSFLQFLLAPVTGAVSDCLGRRPVMLLSLGDWGHQQGKRQPVHSHRGRPGLTFRPQPRHVIGVAFSLAFTLGPMLGAFLPAEMVPWLALLFAASDLLFIFCFLPETLPAEKRASSIGPGFQAAADLLSPVALLRFSAVTRGQDPPAGDGIRHLRRLGLVYFLYLFLFSGLEFTLSFLAHQRFQFSSLQQGKMFFFIGLTMATVQGAYARKISPGSEIAAVKRAILLLVPAFLLIGWGLTLPALGLGLLLYSFAAAVVVPCLSSVVADYGKEPFFARGPPGGRRTASTRRLPPPPPPKACPGRRARSWAHSGAWVPWPGQWDPWWLPQCTGWLGPGSASRCAQASSCSLSCSCATWGLQPAWHPRPSSGASPAPSLGGGGTGPLPSPWGPALAPARHSSSSVVRAPGQSCPSCRGQGLPNTFQVLCSLFSQTHGVSQASK